ncbi:hypothetical protein, variant [Puccinia triticina 1-1 BBBD Race 1]|uniref:Uncharacterized protein n=1 Tax=Puccinia triticina (isolate 1-1 / race 1 (BBBD)) TaxID=630390 RepID=A0A180GQH5_PUCT1|nr:hypothetical protein, variant [Puccinia triticina 1-1 BBBD Race 1]
MPHPSKSSRITPSKQTRKTSSNFGQASPSHDKHETDSLESVKRELIHAIETFSKFRQEWDDLVLNKSLNLIIKIMELEAEIRSTVENSCFLQKCAEDQVVLEDGYAWKQFCKMNGHCSELEARLGDMTKLESKIQKANDHFEELVQKSCASHGMKTIFDTPVGLTWPLPRFCKVITSSVYRATTSIHSNSIIPYVM